MDPLQPFLLPSDVQLTALADLPEHLRSQVAEDGEFAITRPRARAATRMLSRDAADLVREFRTAKTVIEAVISYCSANGSEPERTLEDAFPILQNLVAAQFLVPAASENSADIQPGFEPGRLVDGYAIQTAIQTLEDSEVYRVSTPDGQTAAMKMARLADDRSMKKALDREAAILELVGGVSAPRLLGRGEIERRPFLVMSWIEGQTAMHVADDLRRRGDLDALLVLCIAILRAYGALHAKGVLHCDVHPRNVIVHRATEPVLIDFGLAVRVTGSNRSHVPRGGIAMFFEPEYAKARQAGQPPPAASAASEQYALGALVYMLIAGHPYLQFAIGKAEMLAQIVTATPLPLSGKSGVWSADVEQVVFRALEKEPSARWESVDAFADALESARRPQAPAPVTAAHDESRKAFVDDVFRRLSLDGPLFQSGYPEAPSLSINYGAAGAAYALYRLAVLRSDADQLSCADAWATRAHAQRAGTAGFYSDGMGLTADKVGPISPYHTPSGVFLAKALIAHAMGDFVSAQHAIQGFVTAADQPCDNLDLTLGRSSVLVGCSVLADAMPDHPLLNRVPLLDLGDRISQKIADATRNYPAIPDARELPLLGIAHGWAGLLYALMQWDAVRGRGPRPDLRARLQELAELGEARGTGLRWRIRLDARGRSRAHYMSGWCNGSAGMAFLWTLAHEVFKEDALLRLAERAAINAWTDDERAPT
ncbi:MAG TPA: lanthionine synthetase LanC family protein, partial [Vicinamibacterales bacterium]|nr:lanthionine synthetase LanC family protein [Vicinamibacterales bacterium]